MKVFKKLSMCILSGLLCLGIGATTQAATKTGTNVYEMNTWAGSSVTKDRLTSVDITGNGKKDKIETETTRVEIELKVNGKIVGMILSRLVDTFFSRISLTMQLHPKPHSTAYVLPWEEVLHWQCRSSDCSSS